MSAPRALRGLGCHFVLTLKLNFRSGRAVAYGYVMPVLFLVAFAGLFRGDTPVLIHEMGQLLTITILGGACFGMPTAVVAERERGLWKRYHLLPVGTGVLLLGTLAARVVLLASAVALQILAARVVYGTPLPVNPGQLALGFLLVSGSFLGLGLLVAAMAGDVPSVQALGQCLFLPMIMLGGVGVPLAVLPPWAQAVAGFMPGRYAVEVLQRAYSDPRGLTGLAFGAAALAVIGAAAGTAGARLFRWDAGRPSGRSTWAWVCVALLAWAAVGAAAGLTGRLAPLSPAADAYGAITAAQVEAITYEDLPGDNELATRLAPPFRDGASAARMDEFVAKLGAWGPGRVPDPGQAVRNLLSVAAIADVTANLREAEIARVVYDQLRSRFGRDELERILAWVVLSPGEGSVVTAAPELGLRRRPSEAIVRERDVLYAKKFLGRLLGKIPEQAE
jgi:hypothetical protein